MADGTVEKRERERGGGRGREGEDEVGGRQNANLAF
jgi:hypothetical protein